MSGTAVSASMLSAWERHLGTVTDPRTLTQRLTGGSLSREFAATAHRSGERPALTIGGRTASHAELDRRAAGIGGWLRGRGVSPGDRVLIAGASSHGLVAAYLGTLRCGATALLADAGSTAAELRQMTADAEPVAAFAAAKPGELLATLEPDHAPATLVGLEPDAPGVPLAEAEGPALDPADGSAPAILAYTSGTTGQPKGVPLSHANVLASIRAVMMAWRWRRDDVLVHALPLSHQHGLGGVHATLLAGSHAVVESAFDPERFCTAVREAAATVIMAVPTIYERLGSWEGIEPAGMDRLRLAISGSAPLPETLARRVQDWLGELPLERYGSTEAGLVLSNLYTGPRRPGWVGHPLPGIETRIVDGEGDDLAAGEDGELVVRGPQVFSGYWRRPEATVEAFADGGWFRSGDVARADPEDGAIAITGRLKEMIITGGLNVFPREVETVLDEHPAVGRSAVAGVPSARWGEEIVAFVVPRAGERLNAESVIEHCRERLSSFKCPKRVIVRDELPASAMGKVQRGELVAIAERDRGSSEIRTEED